MYCRWVTPADLRERLRVSLELSVNLHPASVLLGCDTVWREERRGIETDSMGSSGERTTCDVPAVRLPSPSRGDAVALSRRLWTSGAEAGAGGCPARFGAIQGT